jgi:hypothetical protein
MSNSILFPVATDSLKIWRAKPGTVGYFEKADEGVTPAMLLNNSLTLSCQRLIEEGDLLQVLKSTQPSVSPEEKTRLGRM